MDKIIRTIALRTSLAAGDTASADDLRQLDSCGWCRSRLQKGSEVWGVLLRIEPPPVMRVTVLVPVGGRTCIAIVASRDHDGPNATIFTCGQPCLDALNAALAVDPQHRQSNPVRLRLSDSWRPPELRPLDSFSGAERRSIRKLLARSCTWCQQPANAIPPVEVWWRVSEDPIATKGAWVPLEIADRVLHFRVEHQAPNGNYGTYMRFTVCSLDCGEAVKRAVRQAGNDSVLH
jgi:hypothetical protein